MANYKKYYPLPDYTSVTADIDEYIKAWRGMAEPIERELNLKLSGFDPLFQFTAGNPQAASRTVELPVWFVRDLSARLREKQNVAN